jgi:hypothetical protein
VPLDVAEEDATAPLNIVADKEDAAAPLNVVANKEDAPTPLNVVADKEDAAALLNIVADKDDTTAPLNVVDKDEAAAPAAPLNLECLILFWIVYPGLVGGRETLSSLKDSLSACLT